MMHPFDEDKLWLSTVSSAALRSTNPRRVTKPFDSGVIQLRKL